MNVPDVYSERGRIEVVRHEVVITGVPSTTLGRKAERRSETYQMCIILAAWSVSARLNGAPEGKG